MRPAGVRGVGTASSGPCRQGVRYYEHDDSRGHAVIKRILAGEFHGHLVTDFYAAYNDYEGAHQRCWVQLLRDLHELREEHSQEADAVEWAGAVRTIYYQTKAWLSTTRAPTREQREMKYVELVSEAHRLGLRYGQTKKHPCQALAKRLLRHEHERFQSVLVDGLSPDNNLAERSLPRLVVMRKISGGSRGDEGTKTRMALASLLETWQARGLNAFTECLEPAEPPRDKLPA